MANGSGSPKIIDIYYERIELLLNFVFLGKV
jgi:hypothetical protein